MTDPKPAMDELHPDISTPACRQMDGQVWVLSRMFFQAVEVANAEKARAEAAYERIEATETLLYKKNQHIDELKDEIAELRLTGTPRAHKRPGDSYDWKP